MHSHARHMQEMHMRHRGPVTELRCTRDYEAHGKLYATEGDKALAQTSPDPIHGRTYVWIVATYNCFHMPLDEVADYFAPTEAETSEFDADMERAGEDAVRMHMDEEGAS